MIISFDGAAHPLANVPGPLKDRRAAEYLAELQARGFRLLGVPDRDSIRLDVSGVSQEDLYAWLQEAKPACVDVEPGDLKTLVPEDNPSGQFFFRKHLESDPNAQLRLSRVTPEELPDAVREESFRVLPDEVHFNEAPSEDERYLQEHGAGTEEMMVAEMRRAGLDVPDLPESSADQEHSYGGLLDIAMSE